MHLSYAASSPGIGLVAVVSFGSDGQTGCFALAQDQAAKADEAGFDRTRDVIAPQLMCVFNGAINLCLRWMLECILIFHSSVTFILLDVSAFGLEMWLFVAKSKPYSVCIDRIALRLSANAPWSHEDQCGHAIVASTP